MTATSPHDSGNEIATAAAACARHRGARRRRALLGSVLGVVLIAQASGSTPTAGAAAHDAEPGRRPLVREQIDERICEAPDQFALDVCGVAVRAMAEQESQMARNHEATQRVQTGVKQVGDVTMTSLQRQEAQQGRNQQGLYTMRTAVSGDEGLCSKGKTDGSYAAISNTVSPLTSSPALATRGAE